MGPPKENRYECWKTKWFPESLYISVLSGHQGPAAQTQIYMALHGSRHRNCFSVPLPATTLVSTETKGAWLHITGPFYFLKLSPRTLNIVGKERNAQTTVSPKQHIHVTWDECPQILELIFPWSSSTYSQFPVWGHPTLLVSYPRRNQKQHRYYPHCRIVRESVSCPAGQWTRDKYGFRIRAVSQLGLRNTIDIWSLLGQKM